MRLVQHELFYLLVFKMPAGRLDMFLWPYMSRPLEKGPPIAPDRNAP